MKNKNILLIIFILVSVFSIIVVNPISDYDEIWNYNTARAISEGLIPYKDISMITTPLLPMVTAIFLKLIANEVIMSRILAAFIWTGILFFIFKIFKILIKEENICLIITALIGILLKDIFCIDYNVTILLIALIILYLELKNSEKDILIGLLAGLAICTKQSTGITLSVIVVIYKILFIENKNQFVDYLKIALKRIIGILIPIVILAIYLILTGAMQEFINYAILGIKTFSNKIPYSRLLQDERIEIRILSILMPISIILMAIILIINRILKRENEKIEKLLTILLYSLSIIIVMYPISDKIHFLIGGLISILGLIYMICLVGEYTYNKIKLKNKYKLYKIITLIIWIVLSAIILINTINNIYIYILKDKNKEIKHYNNIEINQNLSRRIKNIDEYILKNEQEGNKVYILDAEAAIYMIPIDKYNKNYDMFLKGNIGKDGQEGQIEQIKQREENIIYLIRKPNIGLNWQTPLDVIYYVRNNLEKIGEIEIYEAYR